MDKFENITLTTSIRNSLDKLLNRDLTALTASSGTSFPQEITEDMVRRLCYRTDSKCLYSLESTNPVSWELILDVSSPIPNGKFIEENYQPLASNLTALSAVLAKENTIPYFVNDTQMSTIELTDFSKDFLTSSSAESVRKQLGLGSLATKDVINGATDIANSSITENKLSFTPIKHDEGFSTGDLKETFDTVVEEGWINFSGSIGSSKSGATYANDNCEALFKMMWNLSSVTISPSKGTNSTSDWEANKRLIFPEKPSVFEISNLRIKL